MSSRLSGLHWLPAASAVAVAGLLGCSDVPTVVERDPSAVLIEPAVLELDPGDEQTLQLVVMDGSGRRLSRLPAGMTVYWETDDPRVAWVDASGTVTGRLPGQTAVTARVVYLNQTNSGGASASLASGPPPQAHASMKVRRGNTRLEPAGPTEQSGLAGEMASDDPAVRLVNKNGRPVSRVPIQFVTEDGELTNSLVETDKEGIARTGWRLGSGLGLQEVDAFAPDLQTDTVAFQVAVTGGAAAIEVSSGASQTGVVGQALSAPLAVRVTDDVGQPLANVEVTWQAEQGTMSSAGSTTNADGVATTNWTLGTTAGAQSATASVGNLSPLGFEATAVPGGLAQLVKVSGDGQTADPGATLPQPLVVRAVDGYGNEIGGVTVGWSTVTTGAGKLTVESPTTNGQGLARAAWTVGTEPGEHFVRAAAPNVQDVLFSATVQDADGVARIEISPAGPISFASIGDTARLTVQGYTADGTPVSAGAVNWTSGNTGVVEVNVLGTLLAKGAGTALVVARLAAGTAADTVSVTVTPTVASISVTPSPASVQAGGTVQLVAQPKDAGGSAVQATVTWSSSATSIATVNSSGLVTGVAPGSATITAAVGSVKQDVALTVTAAGVASITVTPSSASVQAGSTVQLNAQPKDAAGNPVQATVTWSSSATSSATVNSSGLVTGVAVGSATITARVGSVSQNVTVTVTSSGGGGGGGGGGGSSPSPAELPRVYLNTSYSAPTGQTIRVPAGGNLQQAIDNASLGDRILLAAGATYGAVTLRAKSGSGWIYIETETSLPAQGTRVDPGSVNFAKIQTSTVEPAIRAQSGVNHYRFVGVEVRASSSLTMTYMLVELQPGSSNITFDRSYVHGHSNLSFQRCITANAASFALVDSYIAECHGQGVDAQAVAAWDSPGPFKIVNNYLEGSTENVLFGGADPSRQVTPSDIEFRKNHVKKQASWEGSRWQVKYLFELKHAVRVLVEDNVFENSFNGADAGWAFVLKSVNQGGSCGFCITRDVTVRYNRIINAQYGFNLLGRENESGGPDPQTAGRFFISQNVFEVREPEIAFQILTGLGATTIEHVTMDPTRTIIMFDGPSMTGPLVMVNNLFGNSAYGVFGGGVGSGTNALAKYAPGYTFTGNGLVGYSASEYPSGNTILSSMSAAPAGMGADVATIYARTSGVRR